MNEQSRTAVVLDSTTYLPKEVLEEHDVPQVSLYVSLEGREERETDITDYGEFYSRLKASREGATTSQPAVGDFLEVWLPILESGREIVSIHLASGISGTYATAIAAREQLIKEGRGGEKIHVVDSDSGASGTGLCAMAAFREAAAGGDARAVEARFAEARSGMEIRFAVDTLEYLRRGGRIGRAQALLGSALKIKPILSFEKEIYPVTKVRTRRRALEHLREFAREQAAVAERHWAVQHVDAADAANELAGECREIFGNEPVFVNEIGPVLGAHTGPGLIGVASIRAGAAR